MKTLIKSALLLLLAISLTGCGGSIGVTIDRAVKQHAIASKSINLGDTKESVLSILEPTQASISPSNLKPPGKYIKDGVLVEIYYMRTGRQPDGLTTDDEFTPYIFHDGKLVGIGWEMLGGAKTQGQVVPIQQYQSPIIINPSNENNNNNGYQIPPMQTCRKVPPLNHIQCY